MILKSARVPRRLFSRVTGRSAPRFTLSTWGTEQEFFFSFSFFIWVLTKCCVDYFLFLNSVQRGMAVELFPFHFSI